MQELDLDFRTPESVVISVRLSREELQALTQAARFHGLKLSSYIKREALEVARRPLVRVDGVTPAMVEFSSPA